MRKTRTTSLVISILAGVLVLSTIVMFAGNGEGGAVNEVKVGSISKTLTSHVPININGASGFTKPDPVNGGGTGTAIDPYIIENWDIDARTAHGIYIANTDVHFIIRNCVLRDGQLNWPWYAGILFLNVTNGKIDSVTSYNNHYGIWLDSSSNSNTISACTIYNNSDCGIFLKYSSNNNIITNCNIYNNCKGIDLWCSSNNNISANNIYNNYYGIYLRDSSNNKLRNNIFLNNGIVISGDSLNCYVHSIDNNTVNSKPLYYYLNQSDILIDSIPIGQLILVNCSRFTVKNITISYIDTGIEVAYSLNNTLSACNIYNNSVHGIYLSYSSNNNIITNCNIYNNYYGIALWNSSNNNISANNIYNNSESIVLYYSSNNNISTCNIYNNSGGVELYSSSNNNVISACTIYNDSYGIVLYDSSNNNQITNCNVYNNSDYGIYLSSSSNNNITNCNVYNNSDDGIYLYSSSSNTEIHYNNIYNNIGYGVISYSYTANATYNWWGSASGPYHLDTNPNGTGDNVTDNVLYEPWLTEPWSGEVLPSLTVTVTANPTAVNSGQTSTITVHITDGTNPLTGATINLASNHSGSFSSVTDNGNGTYTTTFTAPSVTTQTVCRVTANATKTGYTSGSNYVDVTVNPIGVENHAPIVNSITADLTTVTPGGTVAIAADATDEDSDFLTYHYSCSGGTISGTENTATWIAPNTAGAYSVSVYVNDGTNNSNSKSVTITVTSKETPGGGGWKFIPGFEPIYLFAVIGVCAILLRKRKLAQK